MSDEDLQKLLVEIRQNRRTAVTKAPSAPRKKAEAKAKEGSISLDALLASAKNNPEMREKLIQAMLGGKK